MLSCRELGSRKVRSPQVIAPDTIHPSVDKAAWLLGIRLRKTSTDASFKADPAAIEKAINKNTIGVFVTAGTTYVGQVDPIDRVAEIAAEHGLPLHVDAAFGGFVIPFLRDLGLGDYDFDFEIDGVTSISTDPHKMGLAPIPAGCIMFRNKQALESITRDVPYLRGASSKQATLLGTRPAATVLSTWAIMKHLGREGYRQVVAQCMKTTRAAVERVHTSPQLELALNPIMNILALRTRELPLEYVVDKMEERGWSMAISPLPETMRVVIMPHVTDGVMNAFFNDLDQISTTIPASLRAPSS
jgi:tyrosine decarboxylase/aspartate 1-decarboxylase